MDAVRASVRLELLAARRTRTVHVLLLVFLGMVVISSVIGYVTNQTVTNVYREISAEGLTTAPHPFDHVSPLFYARNSTIYVTLIGALLAIVLGAQATLPDRKADTMGIVVSRPHSVRARLCVQLTGLAIVLGTVLGLSGFLTWGIISVITRAPLGIDNTARLIGFWTLSWVLLLTFVLLGMLAGLRSRREATAFLVPFVVWSVVAFVVPQIGTAARPVSLLNSVPAVATPGAGFDMAAMITRPLSVTEQFKQVAGQFLLDTSVSGDPFTAVVIILLTFAVLLLGVLATPRSVFLRGLHA